MTSGNGLDYMGDNQAWREAGAAGDQLDCVRNM